MCNLSFALCMQGNLEQIQSVLNSTEVGLHQLTALVDCRSLHMVSHVCCVKRKDNFSNPRRSTDSSRLLASAFAGLCSGIDGPVL